jgi:hypothetical protein
VVPQSLESVLTLQNSLDSELYNMKHDRRVKERQLAELHSARKKLQMVQDEVHAAALRLPNAQKWVGLSSLTGVYGVLMYCVWDVYSWDVMEPITYFIGFTAVLGNSFYSTITKKVRSVGVDRDAYRTNPLMACRTRRTATCGRSGTPPEWSC